MSIRTPSRYPRDEKSVAHEDDVRRMLGENDRLYLAEGTIKGKVWVVDCDPKHGSYRDEYIGTWVKSWGYRLSDLARKLSR